MTVQVNNSRTTLEHYITTNYHIKMILNDTTESDHKNIEDSVWVLGDTIKKFMPSKLNVRKKLVRP